MTFAFPAFPPIHKKVLSLRLDLCSPVPSHTDSKNLLVVLSESVMTIGRISFVPSTVRHVHMGQE